MPTGKQQSWYRANDNFYVLLGSTIESYRIPHPKIPHPHIPDKFTKPRRSWRNLDAAITDHKKSYGSKSWTESINGQHLIDLYSQNNQYKPIPKQYHVAFMNYICKMNAKISSFNNNNNSNSAIQSNSDNPPTPLLKLMVLPFMLLMPLRSYLV
eukprot:261142_1